MPSNGTGHRKTKKHAKLSQEHYMEHEGKIPMTLSGLKGKAVAEQPKRVAEAMESAAKSYYCPKCKHNHKTDSRIGIEHANSKS